MDQSARVAVARESDKPKLAKPAAAARDRPSSLALPRSVRGGSVAVDRLSREDVLMLQRTIGNRAVMQLLRARSPADAPAASPPSPGPPDLTVVQRDEATEKQEWRTAQNVYMNMPIDAGHITGKVINWGIVRPIMGKWKGQAEWREREKGAWEKARIIEKNQYGRGKLGAVMRGIDTTSRICHLIGALAGLVALVCGIVGFFQPAALPIGAIATVVSLAAHGVMTILQTILIGHNLRRIQGMPPAERAKVMPAIYRDLSKLVLALLGVGLGGLGVGMSVAHGGLMAANAIQGADQTAKIGELVGEQGGEAVGEGGMFWGILAANEKEIGLGMKGALAPPADGGHAKPSLTRSRGRAKLLASDEGSPRPVLTRSEGARNLRVSEAASSSGGSSDVDELAQFSQAVQVDARDGQVQVSKAKQVSQDAVGGVDGLAQDGRKLDQLSATEAQVKVAQASTVQIAALNQSDSGERFKEEAQLKQKSDELKKAERLLGDSGETEAATRPPEPAKANQTAQSAAKPDPVQRKPSTSQTAKGWLLRLFGGIKKRVARAVAKIQAKVTEIALHIAGVKKFQADLDDALVESRSEAAQVASAVNEAEGASDQYAAAAAQFAQQATGLRGKR